MFTRPSLILVLILLLPGGNAFAQCLSSANPVGGSANLLVLEKRSARAIAFYRFNYGNQYFEGSEPSDFSLISEASYNYIGTILGYGLLENLTLEAELGYYINKTHKYDLDPAYSLRGYGFSGGVISARYGFVRNNEKRFFISSGLGARIPFTTRPVISDGVELPVELQPSTGSFGMVLQLFVVKEQPLTGSRYFFTCRADTYLPNGRDYKLGNSVFSSVYYSKHLMFPWLKGDWTMIFQLRNELRGKDRSSTGSVVSTGSSLFYFSPQLNLFAGGRINISLMGDIPLYRHFNGTQMATRYGLSLNFSGDFRTVKGGQQ